MEKSLKFILSLLILIAFIFGCVQPSVKPVNKTNFTEVEIPNETEVVIQEPEIVEEKGVQILIADTENHRVLIIDKESNETLWKYGCSEVNYLGKCSFDKLYRVYGAMFSDGSILVADYENNRVLELSKNGEVLWSYGGEAGYGDGQLNKPNYVNVNPENGDVIVADGLNNRVIEIDKESMEVVWQYGCHKLNSAGKCAYGTGVDELRNPYYVEYVDGNYLITDSENNRVIEVTKEKEIVWNYTGLAIPFMATKLDNGNYLIADSRNNRVIEVSKEKEIVWEMKDLSFPTAARRLPNGNTLILENGKNRLIEVDGDGNVVWEYGGTYGAGDGELAKPRNFDIKI